MITGISDFYYNVTNMEKAVEFYHKALGLHQVYGDEYWTSMEIAGSTHIGLHWTEGAAIPSTPRDAHGQACGGTLTLKSNNISEDRERIIAHGGKILGEGVHPWGHMLVFTDPDGNVLKLKADPK